MEDFALDKNDFESFKEMFRQFFLVLKKSLEDQLEIINIANEIDKDLEELLIKGKDIENVILFDIRLIDIFSLPPDVKAVFLIYFSKDLKTLEKVFYTLHNISQAEKEITLKNISDILEKYKDLPEEQKKAITANLAFSYILHKSKNFFVCFVNNPEGLKEFNKNYLIVMTTGFDSELAQTLCTFLCNYIREKLKYITTKDNK